MESESFIVTPPSWTRTLSLPELFGLGAHEACLPLEIEIGCGKGRFLAARAKKNPGTLFLGIDRLLARLRKVDKKLKREGLTNVRLLRIEAAYAVRHLLAPGAASMIHVYYPDPWPKRRHHRRRLFTVPFMDSLDRVLAAEGAVHVATDHAEYYEEIMTLVKEDPRFVEAPAREPTEDERSEFETLFLAQGTPVRRCAFKKRR